MATWYQDAVWWILRRTFGTSLNNKYNMKAVFHDEEPEPPYFLMGNHAHQFDPYMIGKFTKYTINYMANIEGVSDIQRKFSDLVGAYGKKKGASDFAALKHTIELLKGGAAVGIFPEGDRSWDGRTVDFIPGTAAMAKKYKVPIRLAKMTGNYLSKPRWADNHRKGRLQIEFYTISKEEIESTELKDLEKKIYSILQNDDIKNPLNSEVTFKGKDLAAGIQRILWLCPDCGSQDTLHGDGDDIVCSSCGSRTKIDGNLRFMPTEKTGSDLMDWLLWQEAEMKKLCDSGDNKVLTETKGITISEVVDRKMVAPCTGDFRLYTDRAEFTGDGCGKIVFEIGKINHYIDNFNQAFEFDYKEKRYKMIFNGKNASKWIFFLNYLKER